MVRLYRDWMGFKAVVVECDQTVKQYVMCERIIECMNILADCMDI